MHVTITERLAGIWCNNRYMLRRAFEAIAAQHGGTPAQVRQLIALLDEGAARIWPRALPGRLVGSWSFWNQRLIAVAPWLPRVYRPLVNELSVDPVGSGYLLVLGYEPTREQLEPIAAAIGAELVIGGVDVAIVMAPAAPDPWPDAAIIDLTAAWRALTATFGTLYEAKMAESSDYCSGGHYHRVDGPLGLRELFEQADNDRGRRTVRLFTRNSTRGEVKPAYDEERVDLELELSGCSDLSGVLDGQAMCWREEDFAGNARLEPISLVLSGQVAYPKQRQEGSRSTARLRQLMQQFTVRLEVEDKLTPCLVADD